MISLFKRQWPLIAVGIFLAWVVFYLIRSGMGSIQVPRINGSVLGEGLRLEDIHYTNDHGEKGLKWVLDAKEVRFSGDRNNIFFHDFQLRAEPNNRSWFKLKGKKGDYSRRSGEIKLWGGLRGYSENGFKIRTEDIFINEKKEHLNTDKPVKIVGPSFTVEGKGLFVNLKKERLQIMSDVITVLESESLF